MLWKNESPSGCQNPNYSTEVAFWFCMAPEPRFAEGLLCCVGLCLFLLAMPSETKMANYHNRIRAIAFVCRRSGS
jgi:hypothetical protein